MQRIMSSFLSKLGILKYISSGKNLIESGRITIEPDDVFLVSYPRSGNTWMRFLLAHLMYPENEWTVDNIQQIIPDIYDTRSIGIIGTKPRIIKSHEQNTSKYKKVLYLYRDGRDVSVSYFDYMKKLHNYSSGFGSFLHEMLTKGFDFGTWQAHISSYLWQDKVEDLLAVSYEELHNDPLSVLFRIKEYFSATWTEDAIKQAIQKSSFHLYQKDILSHRYDSHWKKGFRGGVKGGPGAWKDHYSIENTELFWKLAGDVAARLGYQSFR